MNHRSRFVLPSLSILLLLAGLVGQRGPSSASAGTGKIAPEVLAQLEQGGQGTYLVFPFEAVPNNAIYGFEDDLNPADGTQGVIYHKFIGDHYLVVEFHQVQHSPSGAPETFEFILDLDSGAILLQYQEVGWPDLASVGIENRDGSDGILYSYANSGDITDSLAIGFYPVFGAPPADQGALGTYGTLSGTVYLEGTSVPIPGAVVTATGYLHTHTTRTDRTGHYQFKDLCADLFLLRAAIPGYPAGPAEAAQLRWEGAVAVTDLSAPGTPCDQVHSLDLDWDPALPLVGQEVTLYASVLGDPPMTLTWSFGDGTYGEGMVVTHTYTQINRYAVALTATNCFGAGRTSASDVLSIQPHLIYLPLVRKSGQDSPF